MDNIILFVADFDPPTIDYGLAIDKMLASRSVVWLCPLFKDEYSAKRRRDLSTAFAFDICASKGAKVSSCLVALDKKFEVADLVKWCREKHKTSVFKTASFDKSSDIIICATEPLVPIGKEIILLGKPFLKNPTQVLSLKEDAVRTLTPGVLNVIRRHSYYQ